MGQGIVECRGTNECRGKAGRTGEQRFEFEVRLVELVNIVLRAEGRLVERWKQVSMLRRMLRILNVAIHSCSLEQYCGYVNSVQEEFERWLPKEPRCRESDSVH